MSSSKFLPPKFIDDASEYEEYKRKLLRWSRITKVDPAQKAEVVLYHLEGHPSGIQEKIDTALGNDIVDTTDGMDQLIAYLDTIYKEDEMINMWAKYKKFVRLKKREDQPVTEFVAEFEAAYKEAKDNGCEVSDTVLALNLLEACCLSETNEKFVLTGIDFKKGKDNGDCLDQVKKSLRKYQSRDRMSSEKDRDRFHVEDEDDYVRKDTLLAEGWRPPSDAPADTSVRKNSPVYKGQKNKLGADGKPLTCFGCGSVYHFAYDCDRAALVEEEASASTSKKSSSSKGKSKSKPRKKPEQTMLSTLLENKKYSMISVVYSDNEGGDSPNTLHDLLSRDVGDETGTSETLHDLLSNEDDSSVLSTSADHRKVLFVMCLLRMTAVPPQLTLHCMICCQRMSVLLLFLRVMCTLRMRVRYM